MFHTADYVYFAGLVAYLALTSTSPGRRLWPLHRWRLPLLGASLGFGQLDTVGHLPIVAILLAVAARGATPLQNGLQLTVAKS